MPGYSPMAGYASGAGGSALGGALGGPWGMALAAILPSLFGGFFGRHDPNEKARREVSNILDPWNIQKSGDMLFRDTLNSPGYNMARSETIQGGQNAINMMNTRIGQTGLAHSGVGLGAPAAVTAGVGANLGKLSASAWDAAQQNAQRMAMARASTLAGMPTAPNYGANLFAGGLNALLPMLMKQFGGKGQDEQLLEILKQLLGGG